MNDDYPNPTIYTYDIPSSIKDFQRFFVGSSTSSSSSSPVESSSSTTIPPSCIQELLRISWTAKQESIGLRGICWRVMLGLLSNKDRSQWTKELQHSIVYYKQLKDEEMPDIAKVSSQMDPLSALVASSSSGGNSGLSDEWKQYYKNVELLDFIKGDLDRLYLSGIDDDYFQTKTRRDIVLTVLFIWSMQNPAISYRQGMHEIVGCCLFIMDREREFWSTYLVSTDDAVVTNSCKKEMDLLAKCFPKDSILHIEAYTYMLFERIMMELACLYDPLPVADGQPFVVQFCAKIQGKIVAVFILSIHLMFIHSPF